MNVTYIGQPERTSLIIFERKLLKANGLLADLRDINPYGWYLELSIYQWHCQYDLSYKLLADILWDSFSCQQSYVAWFNNETLLKPVHPLRDQIRPKQTIAILNFYLDKACKTCQLKSRANSKKKYAGSEVCMFLKGPDVVLDANF